MKKNRCLEIFILTAIIGLLGWGALHGFKCAHTESESARTETQRQRARAAYQFWKSNLEPVVIAYIADPPPAATEPAQQPTAEEQSRLEADSAVAAFAAFSKWKSRQHNDPPPGCEIVCDDGGHFTVLINGRGAFTYDSIFTNREDAVARAWLAFPTGKIPATARSEAGDPKYNWHLCDEPDLADRINSSLNRLAEEVALPPNPETVISPPPDQVIAILSHRRPIVHRIGSEWSVTFREQNWLTPQCTKGGGR